MKSHHLNVRGHREKFGEGQCEGGIGYDQTFVKVQYDPLLKEIINSPKIGQVIWNRATTP